MPQGSDSCFPPELAWALAPHLKRALDHPLRRRILRALNGNAEPRTLEELATLIPATSLSAIGYHVLTLEECGAVSVTASLTAATASHANRYASNVADDQAVREVLGQTRTCDEPR